MPGYGPSSSRDRTAATAYVCVGCVYFIFVADIPTEKFQPLLFDRHSCVKMYCS